MPDLYARLPSEGRTKLVRKAKKHRLEMFLVRFDCVDLRFSIWNDHIS